MIQTRTPDIVQDSIYIYIILSTKDESIHTKHVWKELLRNLNF